MRRRDGWAVVAGVVVLGAVLLSAAACSTVKGAPELRNWAIDAPHVESPGAAPQWDRPGVLVDPDAAAPVAFEFRSLDLDGEERNGSDLYAARPLIMTFVTPDCPVCRTEGPALGRAAATHPDTTHVVVHSAGDTASYEAWIDASGLDHPDVIHLRDDDLRLWARFGVTAQPSSVLVARDGTLRRVVGALGDDGLARASALVERPVGA